MKQVWLAGLLVSACDGNAARLDGGPADGGSDGTGCVRPALDASWLRGLLGNVVGTLAQAPRATTSQRTTARTYLAGQLTAIGWTPQLQDYPSGTNVYAVIPPTITTTHEIVVGAHFDSVSGSPGANDNATGVAATLAIARYLHDTPCRNVVVTIVLFDEEEPGLFGSRAYANLASAQSADLTAVHTIDQLGWDSDGDHRIELELPTAALEQEYRDAAAVLGVPVTKTTTSGSDHESFRTVGFPAIGITEEFAGGDTSPFRHTGQDTAATVNQDYLVLGTQLVAQVVLTEVTR